MTCNCKKSLTERTVATKTHEVNGVLIVDQSRQALVCDSCGVVAWDPPAKITGPQLIPTPWPFTPARPYVSPNQSPPWRYPNTICGTAITADKAGTTYRLVS